MRRIFGIGTILVATAYLASAQAPAQITIEQQDWSSRAQDIQMRLKELLANNKVMGVEGFVMGSPVTGAPYSADETRESTQTLGDGTHIHNESKVTVYRDGQGRIRRETDKDIQIWDPVAAVNYVLDPKTMTYRKMGVHTMVRTSDGSVETSVHVFSSGPNSTVVAGGGITGQGISVKAGPIMPPDRAKVPILEGITTAAAGPARKEVLGTRTIEGLNCQGERNTSTIEAGAIGNDRPISSVSERWYSPELQVMVMTSRSDPRTGTDEFRLSNVRRGEPDPSLFQVPASYQQAGPAKF